MNDYFSSIPLKWPEKTRKICLALLKDVQQFCHENNLKNYKQLAVMDIFHVSFQYFINSKISNHMDLIEFFQEQTLRYAIDVKWLFS